MRLALVLAVALVLAGAAAASSSAPRLAVRANAPVTVAGSGFPAHVQVRVVVAYGAKKVAKAVLSTRTGSFGAKWPALMVSACTKIAASASAGHIHAIATWRAAQDCGPPRMAP